MCQLTFCVIVVFLCKHLSCADRVSTKYIEALTKDDEEFTDDANYEKFLASLKERAVFNVIQFEDHHYKHQKRELNTQTKDKDGVHEIDSYFTLEFENKKFFIDLTLNEELLPNSFAVTTYTDSGKEKIYKPNIKERNHCYYQGFVRGINGSKVIADTCNGLKGCIMLPNDFLIIQPVENGKHIVYRPKEMIVNKPKDFCASKVPFRNKTRRIPGGIYSETFKYRKNILRQETDEKKFVELMIVADNAMYNKYPNNQDLEAHMKEIANYVDGFYRELGIRVILSHIEIWNTGDKIAAETNAETILENLSKYRSSRIQSDPSSSPWVYADTIHLLYGGDLDGTTLGVAYVGAMCRTDAVGVDQDNSIALNAAATFSHEMGHTFGMEHDGEDCTCPTDKECIMAASTGFRRPMAWSSCSEVALAQSLQLGLGNCLYNVPDPTRMVSGPQCGNDIVEQGEQCDCGYPEQCTSSCCNPQTCQFVSGAVCDSGRCCSNCQIVVAGVECRRAANECDLPEFCLGNSPNCPGNTYKEDGTGCLTGQAACSGGVCLTLEALCKNTWGPDAVVAEDICYDVANIQGTANGNCGHDNSGNQVPCAAEDVKCGKLFCVGGQSFPLGGSVALTLTIGDAISCKAVGSPPDSSIDIIDLGLVRTGATCALGKVCTDRKCQNRQTLVCTQQCNRNGVCNNLNQCHCFDGWAPPFCDTPGKGGSLAAGNHSDVPNEQPFTEGDARDVESAIISTVTNVAGNSTGDGDSARRGIVNIISTLSTLEFVLFAVSNMATLTITSLAMLFSFKVYNGTCGLSQAATKAKYAVR